MLRKAGLALLFFLCGLGLGAGSLSLLGLLPLRFDHEFLKKLGIIKPQIVGFQPYWLLAKADKSYGESVTTRTYFGLTIDADGSLKKLTNPQEEEPGWTNLRGDTMKKILTDAKNTNQKNSLLVFSGNDEVINNILNEPEQMAENMMKDTIPIMTEYGFSDLNLDIETFMEASQSSRQQFTRFTRRVKTKLDESALGSLTIDIPPVSLAKEQIYDSRTLGEIVDYLVIMTYDYHYPGSLTSGPVAPLHGVPDTLEFDVETAVAETVKKVPKEKVLLGIPLYGYEWETITGDPEAATIPGGASTASTARIADMFSKCATCSAKFDNIAQSPYSIVEENDYYNQFYFEDEASVKEKINLAKKYELGGVALWALGYEDSKILEPIMEYKKSFRARQR